MTIGLISFLVLQGFTLILDATVQPLLTQGIRSRQGLALHGLVMTALFGAFLAVSGSSVVAAVLAGALMVLFVVVSNAKHAMLGEALLFSDLALVVAIVRHPGFYLTALSARQKAGLAAGASLLLLALAGLFVPRAAPHLVGIVLCGGAGAALLAVLHRSRHAGLARTPDALGDLAAHGLIATLLLYWLRWRETPAPPPCPAFVVADDAVPPDLILVVQCESFADPTDLTGDPRHALPGLARARAEASHRGDLKVSGFGAYTMRTEFGVLFGRSEEALGFRRYDPFLTASSEASYALPARLRPLGYQCLFVHPHDLRFYGRDRLMPAIGFDLLIGEDQFAPVMPGTGRYIDDHAVGTALQTLASEAATPTFIYAVTMENHGPWMKDRVSGSPGGLDAYLHHVRNSDAMLIALIDHLKNAGRSALLVFFGDHRPSIPGVVEPGPERHTPYVILRIAPDGTVCANPECRTALSPDELHHAILQAVSSRS